MDTELTDAEMTISPARALYFESLEIIRELGICNMFGAADPLREVWPELSRKEARETVCHWMKTYDVRHLLKVKGHDEVRWDLQLSTWSNK